MKNNKTMDVHTRAVEHCPWSFSMYDKFFSYAVPRFFVNYVLAGPVIAQQRRRDLSRLGLSESVIPQPFDRDHCHGHASVGDFSVYTIGVVAWLYDGIIILDIVVVAELFSCVEWFVHNILP